MTHHEIPFDISVGNDALFLMQRGAIKKRRTTESSQSTTPIVQAFHVYRLSTTYELVPAPPPEPGSDVPGHILGLMSTHLGFEATEPARCHPISATIQGMMTLPAFIYEHSGDSFSQQYTDDILALVDITIRGQDNTEHKIRRVLWLRTASTRSALLNTLRCGDICEVMNPPCRVFLNNGFWPELDSVRRHFDFGDYIEIFIEADKPVEETLSCLRVAEISDRKRRIFLDTPPPDSPSQEDDQAGDNWVSTSEEQSSEPRDGTTKELPDMTTEILHDITNITKPSQLFPQPLSHVSDRWCTKAKDVLTAPTTIYLEDLLPAEIQIETTAIRLAIHPSLVDFPSTIETTMPVCLQMVEKHLEEFGHRPQDFVLLQLPADQDAFQFVVLPKWHPSEGQHHYVMVDSTDLERQAIWGTSTYIKADIEYMRELSIHRTGRIVIISQEWIGSDLRLIVFTDTTVDEKIIEKPQWHVMETAPQDTYDHDTISQLMSSQIVETGCHLVRSPLTCTDIKEIFNTANCLSTDLSHLDLPEAILRVLSECVPADRPFDRLRIYVDGSSDPTYKHWDVARVTCDGKPDAWAFVVLGEYYPTAPMTKPTFAFIGYAAHPVCYEQELPYYAGAETIGSDIAEKEGLFWSGLWRIAYNNNCPTLFLSDSTVAGEFAMGRMGTTSKTPGMTHRLTRGVFQALESFLPGDALALRHVRGHHGEIWDELCDSLAKYTANHVEWRQRQNLDLRQWTAVLPHLWMYFNTAQMGLPPLAEQGFLATPPDLPNPDAGIEEKRVYKRQDVQIHLSMATANVRTLEGEIQGFHSKVSYLQEQFGTLAINVVGIQEARTQTTFAIKSGQYIRMASGAERGHFGVELWIARHIPLAYCGKKPLFLLPNHLVVLHRDPRRLFVRAQCGFLDMIFIVIHAPQSGIHVDERKQWWTDTSGLIEVLCKETTFVVLGDCNAATGPKDGIIVFENDDHTSASTHLLRDFCEHHDLCIPTTLPTHVGDGITWTSPNGLIESRIDYFLVPQWLGPSCTFSTTLEEVDLGNGTGDHIAVGATFQWWSHYHTVKETRKTARPLARNAMTKNTTTAQALANYAPSSWQCDIDSQVNHYNGHVEAVLKSNSADPNTTPKKPYISPEIWNFREDKNRAKRRLKKLDRFYRQEILYCTFRSWRHTKQRQADSHLGTTPFQQGLWTSRLLLCSRLHRCASRTKNLLKQAKADYISGFFDQIPENASAATILQQLRPCIGSSNMRKRGRPCLPQVKKEDGTHCLNTEEVQDRWIEFFAAMEGGTRMSLAQQREMWVDNLKVLSADSLDVDLTQVPSLFDLEIALRRVKPGKAVGDDGFLPETCHLYPEIIARQVYAQLLKLVTHGQEALCHKGGRLATAYKRGPHDECASFRSLLVSSHLGKTIHRSLRQNQTALYSAYMQRQQLGGRPKIPVNIALHQVRAYLRQNRQWKRSVALVFLDLQEAFYRVLRPLALGTRWTDDEIAGFATRLDLDHNAIQDLYQELQKPDALQEARIPPMQRKYLQALHLDTHFHLPGQQDVVRTRQGTRPGDSFADVVFGFLWARLLHRLEEELAPLDIFDSLPLKPIPGLFTPSGSTRVTFVGPTWCDDLCICVSTDEGTDLERKAAVAISATLDLCARHGLTPNLRRGKTEAVLSFVGAKSRLLRKRFYSPAEGHVIRAIGEHTIHAVGIVGDYKHLGGLIHVSLVKRAKKPENVWRWHTPPSIYIERSSSTTNVYR